LPNLQELYLSYNSISTIYLSENYIPKLQILYVNNNNLFSCFDNLKKLKLPNLRIYT